MKTSNNKQSSKISFNKFKVIKTICLVFIFLLPIFILISTLRLSNLTTKTSVTKTYDTSIKSSPKNEGASYWPESSADNYIFRSLLSADMPIDNPNINALCTWAKKFNVDPDSSLPSTAFVQSSSANTTFDWDDVGFATTGQFKAFITFYGKNNGLHNFKSISFTNTDIEFNLPEFWLSLAHYMPNLEEIHITSTESEHKSLNALPAEIGTNKFKIIKFTGGNVGTNYSTFLYKDSPLVNSIEQLTIDGCNIQDHLEAEETDKNIYYATDVLFKDYYYCKHLVYLNLNNNKIKHVGTKLVGLPKVVELHLRNNKINTWHNITTTGEEVKEGLGQICFPNPNGISFVDISYNELSELIHLKPSEWNPTSLQKYIDTQTSRYGELKFINISAQTVEKNCFIFGNNVNGGSGSTYADMDIDLSNIFVLPDGLTDSEKIEYISACLLDREEVIKTRSPEGERQPDLWRGLKTSSNVMPSIVDLFGDKCNYINVTADGSPLKDFKVTGNDPVMGVHTWIDQPTPSEKVLKSEKRRVEYYKKSALTEPTDPCYFSSDTSSTFYFDFSTHEPDTKSGSKVLKQATKVEISEFGSPQGIADTYSSSQYIITISPSFKITHPSSVGEQIVSSTYTYNIQIFNDEDHVFYLTPISEINDYIKSISDEDISVNDVYSHFDELITHVGNEDYWKTFRKDRFEDRTYWTVDYVVNNKETRIMTISVTYPTYEYIQAKSSISSVKQTLLLHIKMNPAKDNTLEKVLTLILIIEICLFVILLIPLIIFYIRTKKKADDISAIKTEQITKKYEDTKVHIDIKKDKTVEKKLTLKERFANSVNTGDTSKTKEVKVDEKNIKTDKSATGVISVDDILKDIE